MNREMASGKTVVILGAAGRFGLAAARAFGRAGWRVIGQVRVGRDVADLPEITGVEWLPVALDDLPRLRLSATDAGVVIHALNPGYCNIGWRRDGPRLMEQAIEITQALGATLMFPGNIYNFGGKLPAVLTESTPQLATDAKGRVRIAVEQRLAAAVRAGNLRAVVIRAGDFFGGGTGAWFDEVLGKDLWQGRMTYPGRVDVEHAWAFLPDLAETFVRVAARRAQLDAFDVLHFSGHSVTGRQWHEELSTVVRGMRWLPEGGQLKLTTLPWSLLRLAALVVPRLRATADMHHLWQRPNRLDNTRLLALIGDEPHTPLPRAARAAVAELYPHAISTGSTGGFAGAFS